MRMKHYDKIVYSLRHFFSQSDQCTHGCTKTGYPDLMLSSQRVNIELASKRQGS